MTLVFQPMLPDHYDRVIELWRASKGVGLRSDDSREGITAFLRHNPGLSFVALSDGKVVGAVLCGSDGRRGYLHHLAVAPPFRGKGVGRLLVDSCLAALDDAGIRKAHVHVFADNLDGQAFWDRTGWARRTDMLIMSRDIRPET